MKNFLAHGCVASLLLSMSLLAGCGSDDSSGGLTCGEGTLQSGDRCVAAGSGGSDGGEAGSDGDAATEKAPSAPTFAGVTSVSPASDTSLLVTWDAATDAETSPANLKYNVYLATSAGAENFKAPTITTPPGATSALVSSGLDAGSDYYVVVRAVNEANVEDANTVEKKGKTQADTAAPTFAGAKAATAKSDNTVEVSWDAATDDLTAAEGILYLVYWSATQGGASAGALGTSVYGKTSAVVTVPDPKTTYYFYVAAQDAAGNADTNSVEQSATTLEDETPPTFGGCTAVVSTTASSATLTWNAASDDTTRAADMVYDVYATETAGQYDFSVPAGTSQPGELTANATGLKPKTTYYFVCRARDVSGNHDDNKAERSAKTKDDSTPPTFAGCKSATNPGSDNVEITWDPGTDDQTPSDKLFYDVFCATTAGSEDFTKPPTTSVQGLSGTQVPNLSSNTKYYCVCRARDAAGNSDANTVETSAMTLVSFQKDVQAIFTNNCALSGCHILPNPPANQNLADGFAYTNIVDVPSIEANPPMMRVDSKDHDPMHSWLYLKITGQISDGTSVMPPTGSSNVLSQAQKDTIGQWITQGALQN